MSSREFPPPSRGRSDAVRLDALRKLGDEFDLEGAN
jgi:hypothetical protein